ncbi:MAG: sensor histidine kinase [Gaiellaceae bacterium]
MGQAKVVEGQRGNVWDGRLRGRNMRSRLSAPIVTAAVVSGAATAAVILVPALRFAYRQPEVHVALETAAALIGLLAAYLVFGRFRRSGQLADFVLCYSLCVLAASNLFFAVVPALLDSGADRFGTWARLCSQLLGTALFALAAVTPRRRGLRLSRMQTIAAAISLPAVLLGVSIFVSLFDSWLPRGVALVPTPEASGRPRLVGDVSLLAAQLAGMALYCIAVYGFGRKARSSGDELMKWLAVAAVFGAFARLNYFLYPSLYTAWVYSGDFFRLAFYVAILVAVAREISSYWETVSHTAVLEERRRIARELHDGLAQELAFIGRNVRRLDGGDPAVGRVTASAARALSESRRAIAALTKPLDDPLEVALAEAARETAEREGTKLDLVLTPEIELDYRRRDALIRIACEAIANAARHGGAELVRVELLDGRRVRLRVIDGGSGFDRAAATSRDGGGFGLISMRERAHAVGASFEVQSRPGSGTRVEVVL